MAKANWIVKKGGGAEGKGWEFFTYDKCYREPLIQGWKSFMTSMYSSGTMLWVSVFHITANVSVVTLRGKKKCELGSH